MKLLVRCMHTLDPLLVEFDRDGLKVSCVNNGMYLNQSVLSSESVCYTNTADPLLWTKHKAILLPSSTPEFFMMQSIDDMHLGDTHSGDTHLRDIRLSDMDLGDMDLDEIYADACAIADGTGATGNAVPISGNAVVVPAENATLETNTTTVGPNKPVAGAASGVGAAAATPGNNVPVIDLPAIDVPVALDAGNATEDFEEASVAPTTPTKRLSVEDVPSGMSGFQLYCRWYQRAVKKEIATPRENGCVTKELYRRWQTLSEEEQTRWKSLVN